MNKKEKKKPVKANPSTIICDDFYNFSGYRSTDN